MKNIDPEKLQSSITMVLEAWDVPVLAGTPTAVVASVTRAHVLGKPVLEVLAAKAAACRLEEKEKRAAKRRWHLL